MVRWNYIEKIFLVHNANFVTIETIEKESKKSLTKEVEKVSNEKRREYTTHNKKLSFLHTPTNNKKKTIFFYFFL